MCLILTSSSTAPPKCATLWSPPPTHHTTPTATQPANQPAIHRVNQPHNHPQTPSSRPRYRACNKWRHSWASYRLIINNSPEALQWCHSNLNPWRHHKKSWRHRILIWWRQRLRREVNRGRVLSSLSGPAWTRSWWPIINTCKVRIDNWYICFVM